MPKVVDLPLPLGPRIPYIFPFFISKQRLLTALIEPYDFEILFSLSMLSNF